MILPSLAEAWVCCGWMNSRAGLSTIGATRLLQFAAEGRNAAATTWVPRPASGAAGCVPNARDCTPGRPRCTTLARGLGVATGHGLGSAERVGLQPAGSPWRFLRLRSLRPDFDPRRAAAELGTTGAFFAACPNVRLRPFETFPNDPYLGLQWYAGSSATKAIDLPLAWDSQKGSAAVPIA